MTRKCKGVCQYALRRWEWVETFSVGLMVMLLTTLPASAQDLVWEQMNGLKGIGISSLTAMGTNLYVGTSGFGIHRSKDEGKSWTPVNTGLGHLWIGPFAILGTKLYVSTHSGVYRSENGGDTWIETNKGLTDNMINSFAVMGTTIFAGSNSGGVFRLEDGSDSWTEVSRITNKNVGSLAVTGTKLYAGIWNEGIYRSEDKGNTWTLINKGLTNIKVSSLAFMGTTLYAGFFGVGYFGGQVFRSENGGDSWIEVNRGFPDVRTLAVIGTTLFVGTQSGIFRSDDEGNSWTKVNKGLTKIFDPVVKGETIDVWLLTVMGSTLYASASGGVFRAKLSPSVAESPIVATATAPTSIATPSQLIPIVADKEDVLSPVISISPSPYRTSWALLIGTNNYSHLPPQMRLNYAVNDVEALAKLLTETFDFPTTNVITLKEEQATQKNILDQLSNLTDIKRIAKDDRVLVFFSGHGQTVPLPTGGEMGFLIPYDAQVDLSDVANPGQYYKSCIGMDELKRRSFAIPAKHVLFLVDSCYSGLAAESRGGLDPKTPGLLEKVSKLSVRHIITAGLRGEKAFERPEWGHGAFSYKLLEALRTGASDWNDDSVTTGEELATYLRNVVPTIASQTPHQGRFEGEGEFLFVHKHKVEKPQEQKQKQQVESVSPVPLPAAPTASTASTTPATSTTSPASPASPAPADTERPQIHLIEPSELRGASRDLLIKPLVKSVKIAGIVTDNIGVERVIVDGKEMLLTSAVERDLQLVSVPVFQNYKTVRFETDIVISDSKSRDVKIEAIDATGNSNTLLLQLQFQTSELSKTIIGKDGAEMVLIPAGEFMMGSPEGVGDPDEHPQHTVYLDAFYIDKYEVTNAQYKKFMEATGHPAPAFWNDDRFNKPGQPVVGVTWFDAVAYCKWANKRLPTEAEWEKAARGTDRRRYPWGNEAPNAGGWRANYDPGNRTDDGFEFTAPVGSFPSGVSPYGVMDMAGNIGEWVADWYNENYYEVSPSRNPKGPSRGIYRVLRGGSWLNFVKPHVQYGRPSTRSRLNFLRAADRVRFNPDVKYEYIGFRCSQDVTP